MRRSKLIPYGLEIIAFLVLSITGLAQQEVHSSELNSESIRVQYIKAGDSIDQVTEMPVYYKNVSGNIKLTTYRNKFYQVMVQEIKRSDYTEINGELEYLDTGTSALTLRIIFPVNGTHWKWYSGLDRSYTMKPDSIYSDLVPANTVLPPDGALNGKILRDGGYGDAVGRGKMSYYPLCAISIDGKGKGLGIDLSVPIVYRLKADKHGLVAEFDVATSPLTDKFPNRSFFKLCRFTFDAGWGMRAALKRYYSIYPGSFKKRVTREGIWLPFTPLRKIRNWKDFGFAYHETSWRSTDQKNGRKVPTITSDKETGVLSFQYTEPWDIQLPIQSSAIDYKTLVSSGIVPKSQKEFLDISATEDKNGLWQVRRLKTPWFKSGWAVSITTNCNPDILGESRYRDILKDEINPATKLNVDGIYFDSMEWNWHNDLNYRGEHFKYTNYPLTFSKDVAKPAIWNFTSEFEMMKKIAEEMHSQGKLVMGNGHAWNPFAAANLDLFGAELSWYSSGDHDTRALDFKRVISYQKPIVFLLNEGLNDTAFTRFPYKGYEVYFEKLLAYDFFPSFFSEDASSDPYWQDSIKVERGRPFFKKYIPIVKQLSQAGWQPVTNATTTANAIRTERFGEGDKLFFTIRNNGKKDADCTVSFDLLALGLQKFSANEMISQHSLKVQKNNVYIIVPGGRTKVIQIVRRH
ncbi:MAG TPA: hypothetical protein VFI29_22720 [Hanamia sp.]|nr:hypothetical protein [Hanamia sp.]